MPEGGSFSQSELVMQRVVDAAEFENRRNQRPEYEMPAIGSILGRANENEVEVVIATVSEGVDTEAFALERGPTRDRLRPKKCAWITPSAIPANRSDSCSPRVPRTWRRWRGCARSAALPPGFLMARTALTAPGTSWCWS